MISLTLSSLSIIDKRLTCCPFPFAHLVVVVVAFRSVYLRIAANLLGVAATKPAGNPSFGLGSLLLHGAVELVNLLERFGLGVLGEGFGLVLG